MTISVQPPFRIERTAPNQLCKYQVHFHDGNYYEHGNVFDHYEFVNVFCSKVSLSESLALSAMLVVSRLLYIKKFDLKKFML